MKARSGECNNKSYTAQLRKSLEGTQSIINMTLKNYEETRDLNALKIAFDGYVTMDEMLKEVAEMCSYGDDFELTK